VKFGQGKNGFNPNQIRARLQEKILESWIAALLFIMNLIYYKNNMPLEPVASLVNYLTKQFVK